MKKDGGYFKESRTDLSMRAAAMDVDVDVEAGGTVSGRAVNGGRVSTGRRRWGRGRGRGLLVVAVGLGVAVVVAVGVGVGLKGKGS